MCETMHNTLHTNRQRLKHKYKHLYTFVSQRRKKEPQLLSQSAYSSIHHNCQTHTNTHSFTSVRDCWMISAVISPGVLCFYVSVFKAATKRHTDTTHHFYSRPSLHYIVKLLDILSKLAHTLMCQTICSHKEHMHTF